MAINQRKRQKQLARKAAQASAQRKALRTSSTRGSAANSGFPLAAPAWPVYEALVSESIRNLQQGSVILARRSGDSIAVAVLLVDVGCMGVKSAFGRTMHVTAYAGFVARFREREDFVQTRAECLRKLVEGAVAYAANLGFSPDLDYHTARALFGEIDSGGCDQEFEYGRDGKPFYVAGPDDSSAYIQSVMEKLSRKCGGPAGFHYVIPSPSGGRDDFPEAAE